MMRYLGEIQVFLDQSGIDPGDFWGFILGFFGVQSQGELSDGQWELVVKRVRNAENPEVLEALVDKINAFKAEQVADHTKEQIRAFYQMLDDSDGLTPEDLAYLKSNPHVLQRGRLQFFNRSHFELSFFLEHNRWPAEDEKFKLKSPEAIAFVEKHFPVDEMA